MSPIAIGIIGFLILFILLALGMPIGLGMAAVGFAGMIYFLNGTAALVKMAATPFEHVSSYSLSVLPLFLLMAHVTFNSGITRDLFNLAHKWVGHFKGGVAIATVGACACFSAVSASSMATAATMGLVAIPEMKRLKYDMAMSTGVVAAGGTIGIIIPPSALLIIYGVLTETSIGKLFVAGIIPGLLEAVFYILTIQILCFHKPSRGPRGPKASLKERFSAFKSCGEIAALIVLVLGGLIIGWFTPTEAGAIGAGGAILFSLLRHRLSRDQFKKAVTDTMSMTGMIYFIIVGAFLFNHFLTLTRIPETLAMVVAETDLPRLVTMLMIIGVYLLLGCVVDSFAMIMLTIPIFYPIAESLGYDLIWFGIIVTRVMEMAMITPPIGMNVYVIAGVTPDVPLQTIFKGIVPFFIADIFHVAMLLAVPGVVLFLPSIM